MDTDSDVPRQLDFRGCAVALSVREKALLEEASKTLLPSVDVPNGVIVGHLAQEVINADTRSRRCIRY